MKTTNTLNDKDTLPPHLRTKEYVAVNSKQTSAELASKFQQRLQEAPDVRDAKSYFTPVTITTILTSLFFGADVDTALNVAAVPKPVYLKWKEAAIDHEGLARNFFVLEQVAIAEFEMTCVKNLVLMGTIDTKATLFLLERTKDKYAPRNYISVDSLSASYMDDLVALVSSGTISVDDIKGEVGKLDDEQITYLYGIEAQYNLDKGINESKRKKLMMTGGG